MKRLGLAAALMTAASPAAAQSALSPVERAVAQRVDANNAGALALLERLVNINSGTRNFAGVREVGRILRTEFDGLGFTTRWIDGAAFGRAGHLVAEHPGTGPKILLIGHLDTVFEPDHPFQRFTRLTDSTARGPGIIDMKGGDVIMLHALRALHEAGALRTMNITVVLSGDEEEAGRPLGEARRTLTEAARGAMAAIGFEDGAGDPKSAVVSRRGSNGWTLRTGAAGGHASQIFRDEIGAGALFEAARILEAFRTQLATEPYLAFSPGLMLGGTTTQLDSTGTGGTAAGKRNVIAREVVITGDMRTISPEQLEQTRETMRAIVARHLPRTTASITFDDGYPPLPPGDGNRKLLAMYDQASRDIGSGPVVAVDPVRAGAADVSFVSGLVPMVIDGIGLSGTGGHSDQETADLRMLPVQTKRAALLLLRLQTTSPP